MYILLAVASFAIAMAANYRSRIKQELVLILGHKCYHIHHWMSISLGVAIGMAGATLPKEVLYVLIAIAAGLAMEGALFSDWMQLKEHCERAFTISRLSFTESGLHSDRK